MVIKFEDTSGVIHLCDSSEIHKGITLVWTLCEIDVPANKGFISQDQVTCEKCLKRSALMGGDDGE